MKQRYGLILNFRCVIHILCMMEVEQTGIFLTETFLRELMEVYTSLQLFKIKNNVQPTLLYNKFANKYKRKRCSVRQTYYTTKKM